MLQKQMRCKIKAESLLFPTMYKSQKVTIPTCSGFCGSGSHLVHILHGWNVWIYLISNSPVDLLNTIAKFQSWCHRYIGLLKACNCRKPWKSYCTGLQSKETTLWLILELLVCIFVHLPATWSLIRFHFIEGAA